MYYTKLPVGMFNGVLTITPGSKRMKNALFVITSKGNTRGQKSFANIPQLNTVQLLNAGLVLLPFFLD
jgi:pantothenate kinase type III